MVPVGERPRILQSQSSLSSLILLAHANTVSQLGATIGPDGEKQGGLPGGMVMYVPSTMVNQQHLY